MLMSQIDANSLGGLDVVINTASLVVVQIQIVNSQGTIASEIGTPIQDQIAVSVFVRTRGFVRNESIIILLHVFVVKKLYKSLLSYMSYFFNDK